MEKTEVHENSCKMCQEPSKTSRRCLQPPLLSRVLGWKTYAVSEACSWKASGVSRQSFTAQRHFSTNSESKKSPNAKDAMCAPRIPKIHTPFGLPQVCPIDWRSRPKPSTFQTKRQRRCGRDNVQLLSTPRVWCPELSCAHTCSAT